MSRNVQANGVQFNASEVNFTTLVDQAECFLMNSGRIMNPRTAFMFRPEFMRECYLEACRESPCPQFLTRIFHAFMGFLNGFLSGMKNPG